MNERYIEWYTPWLSSEFELLVFGDKRGLPLVLFPTSGARYYENKDFGLVGTGEWDVTRDESYRLSGVLNSKGVKHWLDDGRWRGHDWNYWQDMLPYYLSLL
jgi:esterase/lipase superfamily enzyme